MRYNIWEKIKKEPNNREREDARKAADAARQSRQGVPGRPGWYVQAGKMSYDPFADPTWQKDQRTRVYAGVEQWKKEQGLL